MRANYEGTTLATIPAELQRDGGAGMTVQLPVRLVLRSETRVVPLASATTQSFAIRHAIFGAR